VVHLAVAIVVVARGARGALRLVVVRHAVARAIGALLVAVVVVIILCQSGEGVG